MKLLWLVVCRFKAVLLFVLCVSSLHAVTLQLGDTRNSRSIGNLRVRVTDTDDRPIGNRAHVQLIGAGGGSVADEGYCNDEGMIAFSAVPVGTYHLTVSGEGIESTESESFEVDERKTTQMEYVRVRRIVAGEVSTKGSGSRIALRDMNVPESASKEFDQASLEMNRQDWQKAVAHLNRAVAIYPKYVEAYTNLGAAYEHLGEASQERQALNKAIELDGHFAPALLNLGLLSITEKKYSEAEDLLNRATSADPNNQQTLMLLAQAQLLDRHFDAAIASTEKLHSLPRHEKYAKAHYIAARAYEHENRGPEAAAQLQIFLSEQPNGPLADAVRKELSNLQAQSAPKLNP
jgi:Flp pilus assembly protein TadD